jgi:hypothetical protein
MQTAENLNFTTGGIYTRCGKLTSFFELSGLEEKGS